MSDVTKAEVIVRITKQKFHLIVPHGIQGNVIRCDCKSPGGLACNTWIKIVLGSTKFYENACSSSENVVVVSSSLPRLIGSRENCE